MTKRTIAAVLAALMAIGGAGIAPAGERAGGLADRPGFGEPLRYRDAQGGAFRPEALVLITDRGVFRAALPATAEARDEDRVDLSSVPLVGDLFGRPLGTDRAREQVLVGQVRRVGDTLVIAAQGFPDGLVRAPVVFATNLPRLGAVSYAVGPLVWAEGAAPPAEAAPRAGVPAGSAHIVGSRLVVASEGGEPAYPSFDAFIRDILE